MATSSTDVDSYGDLYQWGRGTDGHQLRTSATTTTLSGTDVPLHGYFITVSAAPYDWRNPENTNLWQGETGANNPCPAGFRIPTEAEWEEERLSWAPDNNAAGAFASPLKLPAAGKRDVNSYFYDIGSMGWYWSSDVNDIYKISRNLRFYSSNASVINGNRGSAESIRCIKD